MSGPPGRRARLLAVGWDQPLALETLEAAPVPGPAQVLIAVEACGVCHRDLLDRDGRFPFQVTPITPGHEVAGRVVAIGPEVSEWKVGDRVGTLHRDACGQCSSCRQGATSLCQRGGFVFGVLADGGYATHLVAPPSALFALPDDLLDGPEAAVLHCTYGTAYRALRTLGGLRAGERLLVTGANGGVGAAAVDLGHRLGAEVVAVVRDARHQELLRARGADAVVVDGGEFHRRPAVGKVDLALDTVGAPTFPSALRALRIGGRIVTVGNIVAEKVGINLGYLITGGITVFGANGATREEMAELVALHRQAPLLVLVERRFPLEQAEAAQQAVRAGGLRGRVALVP